MKWTIQQKLYSIYISFNLDEMIMNVSWIVHEYLTKTEIQT